MENKYSTGKNISLYIMAALYVLAGINHFWRPETYLKIIPRYLPWHQAINIVTGLAEIIFGLLLFWKPARSRAAWATVVLLVLVFPANIQMAIDYKNQQHPNLWVAYARLPLQPLLIWWALSYTSWYNIPLPHS